MTERTIMHVDLDAFFVSVERLKDPSLIGKPVLVGNAEFGRGVVAAASYEARTFGIHSAMPMNRALRLCPHATVINGSYANYQSYSSQFMAMLANLSPAIEAMSLDEAFVDLTGFDRLYAAPLEVATTLRARVRTELGLPCSAGIATCKVVAKVASETAKPDGQLQVPAGGEAAFLAPLPLRALPGIGKVTEQALLAIGLRTLGDIQQANREALRAAIGDHGAGLQDRAQGIDPSLVLQRERPASISRETTFEADVTDGDRLRQTAELFADHVALALRKQDLDARTVEVKYRITGFQTFNASRALGQPTQDTRVITLAALELVERMRRDHPQPVRLLGMGVGNLSVHAGQLSLFGQDAARRGELDRAMDDIRARFGFGTLMPASTMTIGSDHPIRESLHHPQSGDER